ncbi:MAG: hypothetical protein H6611_07010 [Ignavibacteriales bacterium]|nr:hypothetical protein [Ignavibacteriales bacterium]MCB9207790.1 hypothetical protein [Ignavibacteriales bacterium]
MKFIFFIIFLIVFTFTFSFAQEVVKNEKNKKAVNSTIKNESTQAVEGDVTFSDGTNQLLRITDEGTFGAIQFQNGVPSDVANKLYNVGGVLHFNGTTLNVGGISAINDLSDAKSDGSSVFLGAFAGTNNTSSSYSNTGVGINVLFSNDTGTENTALGYYSLNSNTSGTYNTAIGANSLRSNTNASYNTAIGYYSLNSNTTGQNNTAIGSEALRDNTNGMDNIAIGETSLLKNTNGKNNTAIGNSSLQNNISGENNTAIGYNSGSKTLGNGNIFIGYSAGSNETGSNKLYIENSNSVDPLIYGNFTDDSIKINGNLYVTENAAIGVDNISEYNSLSVGLNNQASGFQSITAGVDNFTFGYQTAAFGKGLKTYHYLATAVGRYNAGGDELTPNQIDWNEDDPLFEIGNGTDDANRSNALTVLKNGNVGIGKFDPTNKFEVNGTSKLKNLIVGNNGTEISEIIEITGTLSSSDETTVAYPNTTYDKTNSRILSLELKQNLTNDWVPSGYYANTTGNEFIYYRLKSSGIYIYHINAAFFNEYRIVIMKVSS